MSLSWIREQSSGGSRGLQVPEASLNCCENKVILFNRLRPAVRIPRCIYLLIFVVEQNLVGNDARTVVRLLGSHTRHTIGPTV